METNEEKIFVDNSKRQEQQGIINIQQFMDQRRTPNPKTTCTRLSGDLPSFYFQPVSGQQGFQDVFQTTQTRSLNPGLQAPDPLLDQSSTSPFKGWRGGSDIENLSYIENLPDSELSPLRRALGSQTLHDPSKGTVAQDAGSNIIETAAVDEHKDPKDVVN